MTKIVHLCCHTNYIILASQFWYVIETLPVADPGFSPGGGRQLPKLLLFSKFLPKTAWKWKNLDPRGGARPWRPPLDPPMVTIGMWSNGKRQIIQYFTRRYYCHSYWHSTVKVSLMKISVIKDLKMSFLFVDKSVLYQVWQQREGKEISSMSKLGKLFYMRETSPAVSGRWNILGQLFSTRNSYIFNTFQNVMSKEQIFPFPINPYQNFWQKRH